MHNFIKLIKLYFLSTYSINEIIKTKNKKEKIRKIIFSFVMFLILILLSYGFYKLCDYMLLSYIPLGLINLIIPQMMAIASIIVLVFTIYMVNGVLFGFKDFDMLLSLPISTKTVILSRIFIIYISNIIIPFLMMTITFLVYIKYAFVTLGFSILYFLFIFLIPLIPIIVGCIIGSIITYISSKFRFKNIIQFLVSLTVILGILFIGINISSSNNLEVANFGLKMMEVIRKIYPLSETYIKIIALQDKVSILLFCLLPLGLFSFFLYALPMVYNHINSLIYVYKTKAIFVFKTLKQELPLISLYKKEIKKYFSSITYMLNTLIGLIILTICSLLMLVFGVDKLNNIFNVTSIKDILVPLLPLIITIFVVMCSTTASSISLEGKNFWIIKSSPINIHDFLLSKIFVNLTITIPFILSNAVMLSIYLHVAAYDFIMMIILPFIYSVFIALVGIIMNLYFPNFTFRNEAEVVKQSNSSLMTILIGGISVIIPFILIFKTSTLMPDTVINFMICIVGIICVLLYSYLFNFVKKRIKEF